MSFRLVANATDGMDSVSQPLTITVSAAAPTPTPTPDPIPSNPVSDDDNGGGGVSDDVAITNTSRRWILSKSTLFTPQ